MRILPPSDVSTMTELNQKLLDHFLNPRNIGEIDHPDGYGRAVNPVNEYFTDVYLKVKNGIIDDIKFKTFGCVVTIAVASALTEIVNGKSVDEIIERKDSLQKLMNLLQNELGEIPEKNWHCPPVAIQALLFALSDYYQRNNDHKSLKYIADIQKEIQCLFKQRLHES